MSVDGHVRVLPIHVANKIAAGEVVERPASVLKELMENALDAGATRVEVNVVQGGRKLVSVRDNGCGMTREDALLSLERQATSKIRDVDDIERVTTLGFRGEAVPSIASVSRFTLTTRRAAAEEGTKLVVNAGTLAEVSVCGAPPGTTVEVRDLFCNVPARRKFLRAYATEEGHLRNTFTILALAHPDVGFTLIVDGREIYRFPPGATVAERVRDFFGAAFAEALLSVDRTTAGVRVHGFVQRPDVQLDVRREQFLFTNARPASAAVIASALRDAYPRCDAKGRPAVVLFIEVDPTQVDVNVHPAKREVRFRRPGDVREAILSAVGDAMGARERIVTDVSAEPEAPKAAAVWEAPQGDAARATPLPYLVPFQPSLPAVPVRPSPEVSQAADPTRVEVSQPAETKAAFDVPAPQGPWRYFHFLAITESGYVLIETEAGLVTLNPIAARERIVYERLLDSRRIVSQTLLIPETVQLTALESARVAKFLDVLRAQGFQLEEFGRDLWKVDAVPQTTERHAAADLLATIAHDLAEIGTKHGGGRWREELVAKSVARSYAHAEKHLTPEGALQLVEELGSCRMPYVCPRGKPVMYLLSFNELKRKFDR